MSLSSFGRLRLGSIRERSRRRPMLAVIHVVISDDFIHRKRLINTSRVVSVE